MRVKEAKALARQWVLEEGQHLAGFYGAYVAGSVSWLTDDADLPATSDLTSTSYLRSLARSS